MSNLYERAVPERQEAVGDPELHSVGLANDSVLRAKEHGDLIVHRNATIRLAALIAHEPGALDQLAQIQGIPTEAAKPDEKQS